MRAILGVDTGGTYTDAVLIEHGSGSVLSHAKALTTYHDLAIGVSKAITEVLADHPTEVGMVALSTTLATNALVEGLGSPVTLMLIGYDASLMRVNAFDRLLGTEDVVYVGGGHDHVGNEQAPFDEAAVTAAALERCGRVAAFAVSGYFSVRNPSHEQRAKAVIEQITGLPVTCGHDLTSRLNAVRRATTAALNARLIPLLTDLIARVRGTLDALHLAVPLMIMRGDGSLVSAEWAMRHPVETILSGPAASLIGARHLSGRPDACVVDIGGTTTDIALLSEGRPSLNVEGAQVGGWRTMVEAVDAHTVGLGGDSLVTLDREHRLTIGPRRVVPLCLLAAQYPALSPRLQQSASDPRHPVQFVFATGRTALHLSESELGLLRRLQVSGPTPLSILLRESPLVLRRIEQLEAQRLVLRAGFTPTDALHVLGRCAEWDVAAARAGAESLAALLGLSVEALCEQIAAAVPERIAAEITAKVLADEGAPADSAPASAEVALRARGLGRAPESRLGVTLTLHLPIVAIGAPAEAYLPRSGELLHTSVDIPPHAGVASAVGAAVGSVIQQMHAHLQPIDGCAIFRLHAPDCMQDFTSIEEGVEFARRTIMHDVEQRARIAGAERIEVHVTRHDRFAPAGDWGTLYIGTDLIFTAVGQPRMTTTPT